MKKIVLALLACALLALPSQAGENATLRMAWWGGTERHEATLKAIQAFEAKNPGVTIKGEYMGWSGYLERLTTQMGSGSEADIIQMDWAWLALFSKSGDGFYNMLSKPGLVDTGAYDQKWLDQATVNGKLNGLPVSFTTQYFILNKTMFDRAGVALPKTWDDLIAAGEAFKEKLGPDYYCLDVNRNQTIYMTHSWIFQKTGKMFVDPATGGIGLSVDEITDWFNFYLKLNQSNAMVPLSVHAAASGDSDSGVQEQPNFVEGKWAGTYNWDSTLTMILATPKKEFEFVLGEFLTQANAKSSGRIGRPAQIMGVSRNSKNPEIATRFVNFLLTTPEAAEILKVTRGVMLAKPAYETLRARNLISPIQQSAVDQLDGVDVYNPHPFFEDPRVLQLLNTTIEEVAYGKVSPREAAESLVREGERILRRLNR